MQKMILDCVETAVLLSYSPQRLFCKNADVPDVFFRLFDVAGLSPTLVLKQNAAANERVDCILFKT